MRYQLPKGTHDAVGKQARQLERIIDLLRYVGDLYGYQPIMTPIFEQTELFSRSVGESSDIVRKEMYTFFDKSNRSLTLRPEMTAGVIRAVVNHKLDNPDQLPLKLYYVGPAFRYERPQLGRFRQFHSFGVEQIGINNPLQIVETIALGYHALQILGLHDVVIKVASLGSKQTRINYQAALIEYYKPHLAGLCSDCQHRYNINPLRLLDCKVAHDKKIAANAPKIKDFYFQEEEQQFDKIVNLLTKEGLPIVVDDLLVRGLDYYSHIVFEFHLKADSDKGLLALGGGGQYDQLLAELGGEDRSGVGFAFGLERLQSALSEHEDNSKEEQLIDIYVMVIDEKAGEYGYQIAQTLRYGGYKAVVNFEQKSFKTLFKTAQRQGAPLAVIIGEDELTKQTLTIKNLVKQTQEIIQSNQLIDHLDSYFSNCDCQCDCSCNHHDNEE